MTAASSRAIAWAACGRIDTAGSSHRRVTPCPRLWPASTSTSPRVSEPSPYSAQRLACSTLTGQTWPAQPRSPRRPLTAARKSPLYCCIIESSRLPPVWPPSRACSSAGSLASRTRRASRSLRARASAHLRTSPGGSTPSSSRKTPELPPLSNIVTTACTVSHGFDLSPPSRLGSPVPPPKHPMSNVLSCIRIVYFVTEHTRPADTGKAADYNRAMPALSPSQHGAIEALARDLDEVFGPRLQALVAYHGNDGDGSVHSCALVDGLAFQDLVKCLPFTGRWQQRRTAVPLMLSADALQRTLDIFPLEYAAIAADHVVVRGRDPFAHVTVPAEDLRRGIEAQAKSHLIHLREAYLESHGEATRIGSVIAASAGPLRNLLANIARLHGERTAPDVVTLSD